MMQFSTVRASGIANDDAEDIGFARKGESLSLQTCGTMLPKKKSMNRNWVRVTPEHTSPCVWIHACWWNLFVYFGMPKSQRRRYEKE